MSFLVPVRSGTYWYVLGYKVRLSTHWYILEDRGTLFYAMVRLANVLVRLGAYWYALARTGMSWHVVVCLCRYWYV